MVCVFLNKKNKKKTNFEYLCEMWNNVIIRSNSSNKNIPYI